MKARRFNFGRLLMDKDASKYSGAAGLNLLAAQADFGKSLMDKDASKYSGASGMNLLAAQRDFGKSLMEKDASKYPGVAGMNLLAAQNDFGKSLMEKDASKYPGASGMNLMVAQANFSKIGLERKVDQQNPIQMKFRAELLTFVNANNDILVGFLGKSGESSFLTLPDAFNYIWGREYHKSKIPLSRDILLRLRSAVTWTDKVNVGREPFILCFGFNIYTLRSPPEGTEPRPRLFPSDVVCYKCDKDKEYSIYRTLHLHFKGNTHTSTGKNEPHKDCEKVWKAYSN